MSVGTVITALILVAIVAAIVWHMVRVKKSGGHVGCEGCGGASSEEGCAGCASTARMLHDIDEAAKHDCCK